MNLDPIILAELQRGGPPLWVSGRTYRAGQCVRSPGDWLKYVRKTNGAGAADPKDDGDNYVRWSKALEAAIDVVGAAVLGVGAAVDGVAGTANAINATVNAINAAKGIKSVQRGVVTPGALTGAVVTLAAVNPSKTFVTADSAFDGHNYMNQILIGAQLTGPTTLVVRSHMRNGNGDASFYPAAWQAVEFY